VKERKITHVSGDVCSAEARLKTCRCSIFSGLLLLLLLLPLFFVVRLDAEASPRTIIVPDEFSSIQSAIDYASVGDTIFVRNGTYNENIVIEKAVRLVGEYPNATIIDGSRVGSVITLRSAQSVHIEGFTIRNSSLGWPNSGIRVINSWLCTFVNNIITVNFIGILLDSSPYNDVYGNVVITNHYGIYLLSSLGNKIGDNSITGNWAGVTLTSSSNNRIHGNLIKDNTYLGIVLSYSRDNSVYYNNFVNNAYQAYVKEANYPNMWDSGYPSGGNYWSDYGGEDLHRGPYQNETGSDGLGDTPYFIDSVNQDRFPHIQTVVVFHDIAVKNIALSATNVYTGTVVGIDVAVKNYGNYTESFSVSIYYDETVIGSQWVTDLEAASELTLNFEWNTTGVQPDMSYTVKAEVSEVLGETNLKNNVLVDGVVRVRSYKLGALKIVEVVPSDESGQPVSNFVKGTMAHFKLAVNNTSPDSEIVLVTVNIYDASKVTLGVVSFRGLIMPGTSVFILGLPIPSATSTGNATVYANAFTDWPHLGGLPYGPELSATFQILGS